MPPCDGAPCGATLNIKRGIAAPFIYLLSKRRATAMMNISDLFDSPSCRPAQISAMSSGTDSWTARVAQRRGGGKEFHLLCSL